MSKKYECLEKELHCMMELRKSLMEKAKAWYETDASNIDTKEFGEVVDMVKDLAEAHEKLWKAEYYKSICEAMEESEEESWPGEATKWREHHNVEHPWTERRGYGETAMHTMDIHSRYSDSYNRFTKAHQNFKKSGDANDKSEMERYGSEHLTESITTMRDIWRNADVGLKRKMKSELQAFVGEMNI